MIQTIQESLSVPLQGDAATERLLIGGALALLSPLLVPMVLINGYLLRVLVAGVRGEGSLPDIHDWKGLATDGLKATAIAAAFGVPFLILLLIIDIGFVTVVGHSVFTDLGLPGFLSLLLVPELVPLFGFPGSLVAVGLLVGFQLLTGIVVSTVLVMLVSLVLVPIVAYPIPAVLAGLGIGGDLRDAFNVGRLRKVLTTRAYLEGVIGGWAVLVAGAIVGSLFSVILVGFIVLFYSQVVAAYVFGRKFTEAADSLAG
jgi:hypothetical protein